MTRLSGGRVRLSSSIVLRAASAATAGGMNAVPSVSRLAGTAWWRALALMSEAWVRSSRLRASFSSVGISTIIVPTRLPNAPCSSSVRTETGIIASSGSEGRSSRSIR